MRNGNDLNRIGSGKDRTVTFKNSRCCRCYRIPERADSARYEQPPQEDRTRYDASK
jgi:hypothetical protein